MICERILGTLSDKSYEGLTIDYVDIEWHEAFKKLHRKTSQSGEDVGIRLENDVLSRGLNQDDVLYADEHKVIAVNIPPCEAIEVIVASDHPRQIAKVCYEIGNRHATLFRGTDDFTFLTPYNEPMLVMLQKIHGVKALVKITKFNFKNAISSSINNHHH